MRIIAFPLTVGKPSRVNNVYYYVQSHPVTGAESAKLGYLERATRKAQETWSDFAEAPQGTWKASADYFRERCACSPRCQHQTFMYGQKVIDNIDYEEVALSSVHIPRLNAGSAKLGVSENAIENDKTSMASL